MLRVASHHHRCLFWFTGVAFRINKYVLNCRTCCTVLCRLWWRVLTVLASTLLPTRLQVQGDRACLLSRLFVRAWKKRQGDLSLGDGEGMGETEEEDVKALKTGNRRGCCLLPSATRAVPRCGSSQMTLPAHSAGAGPSLPAV